VVQQVHLGQPRATGIVHPLFFIGDKMIPAHGFSEAGFCGQLFTGVFRKEESSGPPLR
jgi:hypothetical protein